MSEHVLTSEEVDAILKASQEKGQDLSKVVGSFDPAKEGEKHYNYALSNVNDLTRAETEKNLTSFLRKKILIQTKAFNVSTAEACIPSEDNKHVYTSFRVNPNEYYGVIGLEMNFLNQTLNLLYGGRITDKDPPLTAPGKVGIIVAEKIASLLLSSLQIAYKEYGEMNAEVIRTTTSLNLSSNIGLKPDDNVYSLELSVFFDEVETNIKIILSEDYLVDVIPTRVEGNRHREKDFWRTAIKTQVVDSSVTISVCLPNVSMKVRDFMALNEGDVIPIGDPTLVYLCLNNLKLFRAVAGQSNNKMVAKVINQI